MKNFSLITPRPDHYMTARLLCVRLEISRRTLWRMVGRGHLPEPVRFTRKLVRWRWGLVLAYLKALQDKQRLLAEDAADKVAAAEVAEALADCATVAG